MKIPERLGKLLERDQSLDGAVKIAISRFEPWIKHSHLPFFPEYTDHGLEHLEQVLATASSLIRDEAWAVFTPGDAAVLILSVLLHDCAMHLSEDGFSAILSEPWRDRTIDKMGDSAWHIVWEDFLGEASRFDGRKLMSLFGDTHPVKRPSLDPKEMTKRDRLLIGEFLRRHHPRLAQEIAEYGVPGPTSTQPLSLGESQAAELFPLAGLVARSHGVDVRRYLTVLESFYGKGGHREFRGVHASFLMVLVRIADYLQVQSERAPRQVLAVKQLSSPASKREWRAHNAILDIRQTNDDPEALHIEARPDDVETFFRVQEWSHGIQHELDESWAVLGEVYGRFSELVPLGIVIRRIRSNMDDISTLSNTLTFIPKHAAFRSADADLLKLLIGPLYGDSPAIGMRELIQNSIDAVRELNVLLNDRGQSRSNIDVPSQSADVVASIDEDSSGQHWVTVSDSGIGMTPEVIINYFLTAGASFRRSDDWRKSFETVEGTSKVLRAGRFGIGALAAFLLGNELHVTTRHVDTDTGVAFDATVETECVQLTKCVRPVGTTIRIPVDERIATKLADNIKWENYKSDPKAFAWDWYCASAPSLSRMGFGKMLVQQHKLNESDPPATWQRIDHPDYDGIFWTYSNAPTIVCNGLCVRSGRITLLAGWPLMCPNIWIRDPNGNLPLNLQRSELRNSDIPFIPELCRDIVRSFLAFALFKMPDGSNNPQDFQRILNTKPPHINSSGGHSPWFVTCDGLGYLHPSALATAKCDCLLISRPEALSSLVRTSTFTPEPGTACIHVTYHENKAGFDYWIRQLLDNDGEWSFVTGKPICKGARVLLSEQEFLRCEAGRIPKGIWRRTEVEWKHEGWVLVKVGECGLARFPFQDFASKGRPVDMYDTVCEGYLDSSIAAVESPIVELWNKVFKQPLIPFSMDDRKSQLGHAFSFLAPYNRSDNKEKRE